MSQRCYVKTCKRRTLRQDEGEKRDPDKAGLGIRLGKNERWKRGKSLERSNDRKRAHVRKKEAGSKIEIADTSAQASMSSRAYGIDIASVRTRRDVKMDKRDLPKS